MVNVTLTDADNMTSIGRRRLIFKLYIAAYS